MNVALRVGICHSIQCLCYKCFGATHLEVNYSDLRISTKVGLLRTYNDIYFCLQRLRCYAPLWNFSNIFSTKIVVLCTWMQLLQQSTKVTVLRTLTVIHPPFLKTLQPHRGEIFVEINPDKTPGAAHRNLHLKMFYHQYP